MKMEVEYSSEMSVYIHQTTQHYISKDRNLQSHHHKNFEYNTGENAVNENLIDYLFPSLL
jgi:hypothetical protein